MALITSITVNQTIRFVNDDHASDNFLPMIINITQISSVTGRVLDPVLKYSKGYDHVEEQIKTLFFKVTDQVLLKRLGNT